MRTVDFIEHWQRIYGRTPLIGHVLRTRLPDRWVRIHSLPDSQRYANDDAERAEILRRQNTVLRDLIGEGGACVLVHVDYGGPELSERLGPLTGEVFTTLSQHDSELADDFPQRMAAFSYSDGMLDPLLLAIADWEVHTVLVVGIQARCIVAPYDGGVDIIVEARAQRDELRRRYAAWLSPHPSGT